MKQITLAALVAVLSQGCKRYFTDVEAYDVKMIGVTGVDGVAGVYMNRTAANGFKECSLSLYKLGGPIKGKFKGFVIDRDCDNDADEVWIRKDSPKDSSCKDSSLDKMYRDNLNHQQILYYNSLLERAQRQAPR